MLILDRPQTDPEQHLIALFGAGIIGGAVANRLLERGWLVTGKIHIPWDNELGRQHALVMCGTELLQQARSSEEGRCSFVWSAGRAGFAAGQAQIAQELTAFDDVFNFYREVAPKLAAQSDWHHVSSAGGLFEGQRLVVESSRPQALRPYGELKLRQEAALQSLPSNARFVYRLSSVFGSVQRGQRCGLIPTMAKNGVLGKVTRIVGRAETLRDFTWTDDVANFIASQVAHSSHLEPGTFLLASGRPVSIGEVQRQVERGLRRRLYLHYSEPENGSDITFSDRAIPVHFLRTNFDDCVRRICRECLANVSLLA